AIRIVSPLAMTERAWPIVAHGVVELAQLFAASEPLTETKSGAASTRLALVPRVRPRTRIARAVIDVWRKGVFIVLLLGTPPPRCRPRAQRPAGCPSDVKP